MKTCDCKPGNDFVGIGAGVFVLNEDRTKTLLLLRSKNCTNEPGTWSRPGGTIEYGETIEQCLRRETREEVGVEITNIEFMHVFDHFVPEKKQHWIALGYKAIIAPGQKPYIVEPSKCDDLRWFGKDEIPKNIYSPVKPAIDMWLAE